MAMMRSTHSAALLLVVVLLLVVQCTMVWASDCPCRGQDEQQDQQQEEWLDFEEQGEEEEEGSEFISDAISSVKEKVKSVGRSIKKGVQTVGTKVGGAMEKAGAALKRKSQTKEQKAAAAAAAGGSPTSPSASSPAMSSGSIGAAGAYEDPGPSSNDAMEEDELAELESNMDDELEGSDAEILGFIADGVKAVGRKVGGALSSAGNFLKSKSAKKPKGDAAAAPAGMDPSAAMPPGAAEYDVEADTEGVALDEEAAMDDFAELDENVDEELEGSDAEILGFIKDGIKAVGRKVGGALSSAGNFIKGKSAKKTPTDAAATPAPPGMDLPPGMGEFGEDDALLSFSEIGIAEDFDGAEEEEDEDEEADDDDSDINLAQEDEDEEDEMEGSDGEFISAGFNAVRDKVEDIAESVENGVRAVGVKAGGALERAGKTITRITRKNDAQGSGVPPGPPMSALSSDDEDEAAIEDMLMDYFLEVLSEQE